MAAAQILNLAHTIDNKVTDVGIKLDVVVKGVPDLLAIPSSSPDCVYVC